MKDVGLNRHVHKSTLVEIELSASKELGDPVLDNLQIFISHLADHNQASIVGQLTVVAIFQTDRRK